MNPFHEIASWGPPRSMDALDTRQLKAFRELARRGSFTLAARNLNLTQSAVSHSIKSLEETLGAPLFERSGRSVHLSRAGEILLPHADRILSRSRLAREEIAAFNRPGHGRLRIGGTVTLSQYVLPSVIRELRESFPAYEIAMTTEDTRHLADRLDAGEIDLMFGLETSLPNRYDFDPLFQDHIAMALAPVHPLATKAKLEHADLAEQQYIFYQENSETFRLVDHYFSDAKVRPRAPLQMGSMAAIKEMAKIGVGIGLIAPWVAEDEIRSGALVMRDLPGPALTRHWGIYRDSRRKPTLAETVFSGICRNVVETLQARTEHFRGALGKAS